MKTSHRWLQRALLLILFTLALPECWSVRHTVSGKVSFAGAPVTSGWVTLNFTNRKYAPITGIILPDGTYRITQCPSGQARVTVRVATWSGPEEKRGRPESPSIPRRYADIEKTDLVCQVGRGSPTFDIDLKP